MSVGELQREIGLESSHLSQQLAVLRRAGLVTTRKQGTSVYYSLSSPELEEELFDRLSAYYEGNPDVTVIVDRREGADRRRSRGASSDERRTIRDRRRARIPGTFPSIEAAD